MKTAIVIFAVFLILAIKLGNSQVVEEEKGEYHEQGCSPVVISC